MKTGLVLLNTRTLLALLTTLLLFSCGKSAPKPKPGEPGYQRPNFVFIVSDDQSWIHTSFAGYPFVHTPNFDRIAREGVYFNNAYASSPSCTASRSSIFTGQYPWKLESASVLGGEWPEHLETFQTLLQKQGYDIGFTGKGWGPGLVTGDASQRPEGPPYYFKMEKTHFWESTPDILTTGFVQFMEFRHKDKPFSFWVGSNDPHRPYARGDSSRFKHGNAADYLPAFLPDTDAVKEDLDAYLTRIEYFDNVVGEIIAQLKSYGVYDNTVIVITSDNGMPFSRAKTQNYLYGVKVPLAIYWKGVTHGQRIDDMTSLYDLAPTLLEAAQLPVPADMDGRSLLPILYSQRSGQIEAGRDAVYTLTERHKFDARPNQAGYSSRAIYTHDYALIENNFPERWPAGDNFSEAEPHLLLNANRKPIEPYFSLATAKRPAHELYDLKRDPFQLINLDGDAAMQPIELPLLQQLHDTLTRTQDPVYLTHEDVFSRYPWALKKFDPDR